MNPSLTLFQINAHLENENEVHLAGNIEHADGTHDSSDKGEGSEKFFIIKISMMADDILKNHVQSYGIKISGKMDQCS